MSDLSFRSLIAPVGVDEFMDEFWEKRHVHVPGSPEKLAGLMSWERLDGLLNVATAWNARNFRLLLDGRRISPDEYFEQRTGGYADAGVCLNPERTMALVHHGATIIANGIEDMTPELGHVCRILREQFSARSQANLYCSRHGRQGFRTHYDAHDVFALHVVGEKVWHLYSARADHPIDMPEFSMSFDECERTRGEQIDEVVMTPGDVLYLPRGMYHDAMASSEGTIHVTFAVEGVVGADIVEQLLALCRRQSMFRHYLPRREQGEAPLREHIAGLIEAIAQAGKSEEFVQGVRDYQRDFQRSPPVFALSAKDSDPAFSLASDGLEIVRRNGHCALVGPDFSVEIPDAILSQVRWIVASRQFRLSEFVVQFGSVSTNDLRIILEQLQSMKVLRTTD